MKNKIPTIIYFKKVLSFLFGLNFLMFFYLGIIFDDLGNKPRLPNPITGEVFKFSYKGTFIYCTQDELLRHHLVLNWTFTILFITMILGSIYHFKIKGKYK